MPSEAKNQKVLVFDKKYNDIFNENTTALKMLLPYQIYIPIEEKKKEIQKKKRNKSPVSERDAFVSRASFHILNSVKIIAENEDIDLNTKEGIDKAIERAIKYIEEVVHDEMKRRGELYTHDKFFKEIPTNKFIREHILAKYP